MLEGTSPSRELSSFSAILMQIGFKLAKPGLMKDFAGQWTIQPLMQKDLMSSQRSDQLKGLSGVMYSFVSHACC